MKVLLLVEKERKLLNSKKMSKFYLYDPVLCTRDVRSRGTVEEFLTLVSEEEQSGYGKTKASRERKKKMMTGKKERTRKRKREKEEKKERRRARRLPLLRVKLEKQKR